MSENRWDNMGIPHKGWSCIDVIDLRGDGAGSDETSYETCQMCGHEKIRYVHVMEHCDLEDSLRVGCVCAEKMSDDDKVANLFGEEAYGKAKFAKAAK